MNQNAEKLLAIYLNDHYLGANAGASLAKRIARNHQGGAAGSQLREVAFEIEEDLKSLVGIMRRLDVTPSRWRAVAGMAFERVSRLKLNGGLFSRSPLSSVIELEALLTGVAGKQAGWAALRSLADDHPRLDAVQLDRLHGRARRQLEIVEELRLAAVAGSFQPAS